MLRVDKRLCCDILFSYWFSFLKQERIWNMVGKQVFVRTVTFYFTGRVVEMTDREFALTDVAVIADTGRFSTAMATGTFSEVEPYPDGMEVRINRDTVVDYCIWPHALPREVK